MKQLHFFRVKRGTSQEYYAKRPQVQERLTIQIANELKEVLQTEDVAVIIDAHHLCPDLYLLVRYI